MKSTLSSRGVRQNAETILRSMTAPCPPSFSPPRTFARSLLRFSCSCSCSCCASMPSILMLPASTLPSAPPSNLRSLQRTAPLAIASASVRSLLQIAHCFPHRHGSRYKPIINQHFMDPENYTQVTPGLRSSYGMPTSLTWPYPTYVYPRILGPSTILLTP